MNTSTRTLLRRRQDQLAVKSTLSLTKNSVPELNDRSLYIICLLCKEGSKIRLKDIKYTKKLQSDENCVDVVCVCMGERKVK